MVCINESGEIVMGGAKEPCIDLKHRVLGRALWCREYTAPLPFLMSTHMHVATARLGLHDIVGKPPYVAPQCHR
jgi:hypothetical protein